MATSPAASVPQLHTAQVCFQAPGSFLFRPFNIASQTQKELRSTLRYLFLNNSFQLMTSVSGNVPNSADVLIRKRWPSGLTS